MENGWVRTTGKAVHVGLHLPKNTAIRQEVRAFSDLSVSGLPSGRGWRGCHRTRQGVRHSGQKGSRRWHWCGPRPAASQASPQSAGGSPKLAMSSPASCRGDTEGGRRCLESPKQAGLRTAGAREALGGENHSGFPLTVNAVTTLNRQALSLPRLPLPSRYPPSHSRRSHL